MIEPWHPSELGLPPFKAAPIPIKPGEKIKETAQKWARASYGDQFTWGYRYTFILACLVIPHDSDTKLHDADTETRPAEKKTHSSPSLH